VERSILRILDANFNRAREALRVMEDYARFVLDDPAGCETAKRMRHDLAACIRRLPDGALLAARDAPGDVGTAISTETERRRANAADVFTAAAKRLPEALRTIEEYAKTLDPEFSATIEALRYRAYDLDQRLALRGDRAARFARTRLYVLITESLCRAGGRASPPPGEGQMAAQGGRDARPPSPPPSAGAPAWLDVAEAAIAGGADCIQLREKSLDDAERLVRARRLAALCRQHGVLFIVNDRPDLAVLADADGVHLGQTDLPLKDARRIVGPDRLIGLSTHTPEQLRDAIAAAPDYIAVGPMFGSSTKPQDHIPGPELLALAAGQTQIPIVPIGGITAANAGILVKAGARRLCVCSAVIGVEDPRTAAQQLLVRVPGVAEQRR
jgi:thiamine-phosphate pyrophosphorylase